MSEMAFRTRKNVERGLILSIRNLSDGCGLLLVKLMWVTDCPTLWFAIGQAHVSDRLPHPHTSKHVIIREEMLLKREEKLFWLMNF